MLGELLGSLRVYIGVRSPAAAAGVRAFLLEAQLNIVNGAGEADVLIVDDGWLPELERLSGFAGGVVALGSPVWAAALAEAGPAGWAALGSDAGPLEVVAGVLAAAAGLAAVGAERAELLGAELLGDEALSEAGLSGSGLTGLGGDDSRLDTAPGDVTLTPREHEVLELLSAGLSNKRAARQLGVSEHTVKFHAQAIYSKLGVSSRAAAVTRGVQLGLLSV